MQSSRVSIQPFYSNLNLSLPAWAEIMQSEFDRAVHSVSTAPAYKTGCWVLRSSGLFGPFGIRSFTIYVS